MSETLRYDVNRDARVQHERCGGVPDFVKPDRPNTRCLRERGESPRDGLRPQCSTYLVGEDESSLITFLWPRPERGELLRGLGLLVGAKSGDRARVEIDRPARFLRLRSRPEQPFRVER